MPVLTDGLISSLKPSRKAQRDVYDSRVSGFGLRFGRGGAKAFFVFWRAAGKNRRITLGRADKGMSVNDARRLAVERLAKVAESAELSAAESRTPTFGYLVAL